MSKLAILLSLFFFASQPIEAKRIYVEMEYDNHSIKLDYGTDKKPKTVKDADGNDLKFKSLVGAFNYMSLQGWELLETKSVIQGRGSAYTGTSSTSTNIYYIFYKDVTDEDLQNIVTKSYKDD